MDDRDSQFSTDSSRNPSVEPSSQRHEDNFKKRKEVESETDAQHTHELEKINIVTTFNKEADGDKSVRDSEVITADSAPDTVTKQPTIFKPESNVSTWDSLVSCTECRQVDDL